MYKLFYFVMRKINIIGKKFRLDDTIEAVLEGKVKRIGNGAMVMASKRYLGKKVYVLVRK